MTEGISSARPAALEAFAVACGHIDDAVRPSLRELYVAGAGALTGRPAVLAAVAGVKAHLSRSAALAASVAEVALAFREADGGRAPAAEIVFVADDALAAAVGAGLFDTDSDAERRGRAAGLRGVELARYVRGAEIAGAIAAGDRSAHWLAVVPLYERDVEFAWGFYDELGGERTVSLMARLATAAALWPWRSDIEFATVVPALSTMLGLACRPRCSNVAVSVSRALREAPLDIRARVATGYASAGSFPPEVLKAMLDAVLEPAGPWSLPGFGAPPGWGRAPDLDLGDPYAVVLEAVDRSGGASAVLGADPRYAAGLLDPERLYSARAAAALDRVLDRPRVELLAHPDARDAIAAVVNLALGCGAHGGTVHDAAATALARLVVDFPGEISGAGAGVGVRSLRTALGEALAVRAGTIDGVDLVAGARQTGDEFVERVTDADWSPRINAALTEHAHGRFATALVAGAAGDDAAAVELARLAGEADMTRITSQLRRDVHEGRALDDRDAMVREVGGYVIDAITTPIKSPVLGLGAELAGERAVGFAFPGGHADAAVDQFDVAVAGVTTVASVEAVTFGAATGTMPPNLTPAAAATMLETDDGTRTLAQLARKLPRWVQALTNARTDAARHVLVGVTSS